MKPLTEQERRESYGWPDPLDQFLSKNHTLPERLRIAQHSRSTLPYLESLIIAAKSEDPAVSLKARVNLNLTLHATGARR